MVQVMMKNEAEFTFVTSDFTGVRSRLNSKIVFHTASIFIRGHRICIDFLDRIQKSFSFIFPYLGLEPEWHERFSYAQRSSVGNKICSNSPVELTPKRDRFVFGD